MTDPSEGRLVIDPSDPQLRQRIALALQYRAEKYGTPVRHYLDFADAVIAALVEHR